MVVLDEGGDKEMYHVHHQLEESTSNAVSTYCLSATILSLSLPEGSGVVVLEVSAPSPSGSQKATLGSGASLSSRTDGDSGKCSVVSNSV